MDSTDMLTRSKFAMFLMIVFLIASLVPTLAVSSSYEPSEGRLEVDTIVRRNLLQGGSQGGGGGGGGGGDDYSFLVPYHGWTMTTGFGILFPAGILQPILFKDTKYWRPFPFQLHRVINILAALFITAGLAIGTYLNVDGSSTHVHRAIGIAVFTLVWLQVLVATFARPAMHGKSRGVYKVLHWWAGRTALLVGIGNAFVGMNISQPASRYYAGFAVAIGGWLLLAMFGQAFIYSFLQYDYEGNVIASPIAKEVERPITYTNGVASPNGAISDGNNHALPA